MKEDFFDEKNIEKFLKHEENNNWENSNPMYYRIFRERINFFSYFKKFSCQKHCEMMLSFDSQYNVINARNIIELVVSIENLKKIILCAIIIMNSGWIQDQ